VRRKAKGASSRGPPDFTEKLFVRTNAPQGGEGGPFGLAEKRCPPAHVWCATERKFYFEKLPRAKVVS
jgi:hypothetical protein